MPKFYIEGDRELTHRLNEGISYYGLGDGPSDGETNMDPKPLQPLDSGVIVIAGAKLTNFGEDIRNHPRVIIWNSQEEHWTNKDLPSNVRAVFMTRFISHTAASRIMTDARKRHITIFNSNGTGMINRQIRELLNIPPKDTIQYEPELPTPQLTITEKETTMPTKSGSPKLHVLLPFVDFNKSNTENADILLRKCAELGVVSTRASLANFVGMKRREGNAPYKTAHKARPSKRAKIVVKVENTAVEILDKLMSDLGDIRDYIVETAAENTKLKERFNTLRDLFKE